MGLRFLLLCLLSPLVAGADTLEVYGHLTGKTVLRPSTLPVLPEVTIGDQPADKTNAIVRIEKALADLGLEVVQDGPHFVRIHPKGERDSLMNAPLRGAELAPLSATESIGPGWLDFRNADLNQVLLIYGSLSQRTVLRPITLPLPGITLRTECALTKAETIYAMETVLALNGICVVKDGAKLVQVVPMAMRPAVKTAAPQPEPGAKLFDPKKVPAMEGFGRPVPVPAPSKSLTGPQRLEEDFERLRQAFYQFLQGPDSGKHPTPTQRLLVLYASLAGKTAIPSKDFGNWPTFFHVDTPLTKAELLYAIETTFMLNNLAIIPVGNDQVRLGHISEAKKP